MPQVFDSSGRPLAGVFGGYSNGQVVAYTGTAGTIAQPLGTSQATGSVTSNNTNVSDADTVTIGNKTYTFKTALTPTEGEVLIGADADASLLNLARAILHTGTADTDYKCAAAHTQVGAGTIAAHVLPITALVGGDAGNVALSEVAATLTVTAALTGGVDDRGPRLVRVFCTTIAFVRIGVNPTAVNTDHPVPANVPQTFAFRPGDKVSAVQSAAGGNLHVVEVF